MDSLVVDEISAGAGLPAVVFGVRDLRGLLCIISPVPFEQHTSVCLYAVCDFSKNSDAQRA